MTTLYAKLENGVLVTTCASEEDADLITQLLSDGFKLYDESASQPQAEEFQAAVPVYRDTGERIVLEWKVEENSPEKVEAEIERLKAELTATVTRSSSLTNTLLPVCRPLMISKSCTLHANSSEYGSGSWRHCSRRKNPSILRRHRRGTPEAR